MTPANSVPASSGKSVESVNPAYQHDGVTIYQGDVLAVLPQLETGSVHCVVTSPPYWGLRDYGIPASIWGGSGDCEHEWGDLITENATNHTDKRRWQHTRNGRDEEQPKEKRVAWLRTEVPQGKFCQICGAWAGCFGLEPTPELFVEHGVTIFREVKRVLRDDGTLWLNMGDSYASQPNQRVQDGERYDVAGWKQATNRGSCTVGSRSVEGLKPKDLVGMPWRLAFALQADGWYLRSDIIWAKPNPMPESVTDRPTKSHEYLFLLTKSEHYYYDAEAIKEPVSGEAHARGDGVNPKAIGRPLAPRDRWDTKDYLIPGQKPQKRASRNKQNESFSGAVNEIVFSRNKRSVWTVPTEPFPEAHFATFPLELIKPCILAGCPDKSCAKCGAPWERITELTRSFQGWRTDTAIERDDKHGPARLQGGGETFDVRRGPVVHSTTLGWQPTCACFFQGELTPQEKLHIAQQKGWLRPGIVLDPFFGSGTTGQVARQNGCHAIGIELNAEYIKIAARRLSQATLNFVTPEAEPEPEPAAQEKLFA